jgi:hypothetical protein
MRLGCVVALALAVAGAPDAAYLDLLRAANAPLPAALTVVGARLATARPVEADEVLLRLPRRLALSKDSAQGTVLLRYLDPVDGRRPAGLPHWAALPHAFVLALQLLLSMRPAQGGGDASAMWRSWLALAATQLNGTAHWAAEERSWLAGSVAVEGDGEVAATRAEERALLSALRAHDGAFFGDWSADALRHAAAIVEVRCFCARPGHASRAPRTEPSAGRRTRSSRRRRVRPCCCRCHCCRSVGLPTPRSRTTAPMATCCCVRRCRCQRARCCAPARAALPTQR